jgi:alginate O-acetyltransferase complex protein AlgJ
LVDSVVHLDRTAMANENRALAPLPDFKPGRQGWRDFFSGWEAYYRDHFGCRNRLVRWSNRWKREWFRESNQSSVVIGREGWLFYVGDYVLDNYVGDKRLSEADLESWRELLERRRDWLARRGIHYLFVLAPDKHSIYPEYLPAWVVKRPAPVKLDQFFTYLKAHSTVPVLDLRPSLLEAKKAVTIYLQNDTHWNHYGGFVGYQAVLRALSAQMPALQPRSLADFDWKFVPQPGGDLAGSLGQADQLVETNAINFIPHAPFQLATWRSAPERLPKKWRPKAEPAVSTTPGQTGKALVFRDSFAGAWMPFLGCHFAETVYIWQYEWDAALIEREKPDVVIDEMLERFFNNQDPRKLMQLDALPGAP